MRGYECFVSLPGVWMEMPVHLLEPFFFHWHKWSFFWLFLNGVTVDTIRREGQIQGQVGELQMEKRGVEGLFRQFAAGCVSRFGTLGTIGLFFQAADQ